MSKSNRSEDLLDAWHRGELSDEGKLEWEALLQNADIAVEQQQQIELIAAIEDKGRNQLKAEMKEWSSERKRRSINKNIFLWSAIAASIFLCILIFVFQQKPLDLQAYEEPFPNVISSTHRTLSNASGSEIAAAMQPYDLDDWQTATEKIGDYIQKNKGPEAMYLYHGISAYHLGSFLEAESAFKHLLEKSQDPTFREPAKWFSALTYLRQNDVDTAKKILGEIANSQHYRALDAHELLKKL